MLSEMMLGQFFPGDSFVHHLDPRTKLIATLIYIVAIFLAQTPLTYGILIGFAFLVVLLSRLPILMVLKSLKPVWFIVVITLLIHTFTFPGKEILWQWQMFTVTKEGLELGVKMGLRLTLLLLFSSVLTFTTSPIVLTDGIERLLRPLKCVGVPAHEIAMMMTIALRFIPTLLEETERIIKAQEARGADFGNGNMMKKIKGMLPLLVPLFVSAFRRADELATAMEARCYRGGEGRTRMYELHYHKEDILAFVVMLILIGVLMACRLMQ